MAKSRSRSSSSSVKRKVMGFFGNLKSKVSARPGYYLLLVLVAVLAVVLLYKFVKYCIRKHRESRVRKAFKMIPLLGMAPETLECVIMYYSDLWDNDMVKKFEDLVKTSPDKARFFYTVAMKVGKCGGSPQPVTMY